MAFALTPLSAPRIHRTVILRFPPKTAGSSNLSAPVLPTLSKLHLTHSSIFSALYSRQPPPQLPSRYDSHKLRRIWDLSAPRGLKIMAFWDLILLSRYSTRSCVLLMAVLVVSSVYRNQFVSCFLSEVDVVMSYLHLLLCRLRECGVGLTLDALEWCRLVDKAIVRSDG